MASFNNMAKSVRGWFFDNYSKGLGDMLFVTSALGWVLSSAGQILSIATNDKISTKKKKFLIPQEIADAVINIGSFVVVTGGIKKGMKYLATSGRVTTKGIIKTCNDHGIDLAAKKLNIGESILKRASGFETTLKTNKEYNIPMNSDIQAKFQADATYLQSFYDKTYAPFEDGMTVAGTVIGGIISGNIITPYLRNPIAAVKQKFDIVMEQQQAQLEKTNKQSLNKQPLNTYQPRVTQPNGGMKI